MLRRFYADVPAFIPGETLTLAAEESRHMLRSLRMNAGDRIVLFNGRGAEAEAVIAGAGPGGASLRIEDLRDELVLSRETRVPVSLALPFLKAGKLEAALRMCAEMGAANFYLFSSERCASRPERSSLEKKIRRLRRIVLDAVRVSGRTILPAVEALDSLDALCRSAPGALKIAAWEERSGPLLSKIVKDKSRAGALDGNNGLQIITGPEGGFTGEEAGLLEKNGALLCSMGPRILRAETAPAAALGAVLCALGEI